MTALTLARWPISRRVGHIMFIAVATFGTGTILLALAPSLLFAMGAMFIVGAADTASVVIRQSLLLLHTPDEMRGRVFAVGSMFTGTSNQLGDFRAGAAAALFGTIPAVLIGGFSTLAVVAVSTQVFRELFTPTATNRPSNQPSRDAGIRRVAAASYWRLKLMILSGG